MYTDMNVGASQTSFIFTFSYLHSITLIIQLSNLLQDLLLLLLLFSGKE